MAATWPSLLTVLVAMSVVSASYLRHSDTSSLVLRRLTRSDPIVEEQPVLKLAEVKMYEMHVLTRVQHRFANTLITSRVANNHDIAKDISFSVVLPETAFISGFSMEIDGKVYKAYVKEKEEARREYDRAVESGQGAAHVAVSARDSNRFDVSVNVEPSKKVSFNLTYDELLTRRLGTYNLAINLDPGQVVRDFTVDVFITENRNLTVLRVPELRSGNEVDADDTTPANTLATIQRQSPTEAHVSFHPSPAEQKMLGHRSSKSLDHGGVDRDIRNPDGLMGQFVVQYDVDRSTEVGEVLVDDGYFVHYFAPKDLLPLKKHVVFILDVSGSMHGRKMAQLKEAMAAILDELSEGDYFNIIQFSSSVQTWDLRNPADNGSDDSFYSDWPIGEHVTTVHVPAFPATPEFVEQAKKNVNQMNARGGTNIYDALKTGLNVIRTAVQNTNLSSEVKADPTIIFLTDGDPTVGKTSLNDISSMVKELNINPSCQIFSLAFGNDADLNFLKKLSLQNSGFARKIYEASDAALQLRNFYRQIASPLLSNVTFVYKPDQIVEGKTTKTKFHSFLSGSEIVVAGKIHENPEILKNNDLFEAVISGVSETGNRSFISRRPMHPDRDVITHVTPQALTPASSLERLWAYLTIQQLLEEDKASSSAVQDSQNNTLRTPKQEALNLALKYSFVTPVTSMVVVKPNSSEEAAVKPADQEKPLTAVPRSFSAMHHRPSYSSASASSYPAPMSAPRGDHYGSQMRLHSPQKRVLSSGSGMPLSGHRIVPLSIESEENRMIIGDSLDDSSVESDATQINVEKGMSLINLDQLEWLQAVKNGSQIKLPTGTFLLDLTNQNQTDLTDLINCRTPEGLPGSCRHLQQCSLEAFKTDINSYLGYFCAIDSYAGACCPITLLRIPHKVDTP